MKSKKVYIVKVYYGEFGSTSSYIQGIYATRELAEKACEDFIRNTDVYNIEKLIEQADKIKERLRTCNSVHDEYDYDIFKFEQLLKDELNIDIIIYQNYKELNYTNYDKPFIIEMDLVMDLIS